MTSIIWKPPLLITDSRSSWVEEHYLSERRYADTYCKYLIPPPDFTYCGASIKAIAWAGLGELSELFTRPENIEEFRKWKLTELTLDASVRSYCSYINTPTSMLVITEDTFGFLTLTPEPGNADHPPRVTWEWERRYLPPNQSWVMGSGPTMLFSDPLLLPYRALLQWDLPAEVMMALSYRADPDSTGGPLHGWHRDLGPCTVLYPDEDYVYRTVMLLCYRSRLLYPKIYSVMKAWLAAHPPRPDAPTDAIVKGEQVASSGLYLAFNPKPYMAPLPDAAPIQDALPIHKDKTSYRRQYQPSKNARKQW